jgi:hypothetical protein
MKRFICSFMLTPLMMFDIAIADQKYADPYALEPSINGGVSASGLYASQAEEDATLADQYAEQFEPCIDGGVSASGLFASQAEEDIFTNAIAAR